MGLSPKSRFHQIGISPASCNKILVESSHTSLVNKDLFISIGAYPWMNTCLFCHFFRVQTPLDWKMMGELCLKNTNYINLHPPTVFQLSPCFWKNRVKDTTQSGGHPLWTWKRFHKATLPRTTKASWNDDSWEHELQPKPPTSWDDDFFRSNGSVNDSASRPNMLTQHVNNRSENNLRLETLILQLLNLDIFPATVRIKPGMIQHPIFPYIVCFYIPKTLNVCCIMLYLPTFTP